jgi:hypothetical protein
MRQIIKDSLSDQFDVIEAVHGHEAVGCPHGANGLDDWIRSSAPLFPNSKLMQCHPLG